MTCLNMIIIHTNHIHVEYRITNCEGKEHEIYIEFMNADFQIFERLYNKNYIYFLKII